MHSSPKEIDERKRKLKMAVGKVQKYCLNGSVNLRKRELLIGMWIPLGCQREYTILSQRRDWTSHL